MSREEQTVDLSRAAHNVGLAVGVLCMCYGVLNLLILRSFMASIVPSAQGREVPEALNIVVGVAAVVVLVAIAPGTLAKMTSKLPERLPTLSSKVVETVFLLLAVAAVIRGVLRIPTVVSKGFPVMAVVTEVWFVTVGVLGTVLWVILQGCRYQLRRHKTHGEELPWDPSLDAPMSVKEFIRRRYGKE